MHSFLVGLKKLYVVLCEYTSMEIGNVVAEVTAF